MNRFMEANQAEFSVVAMCWVLAVCRRPYYGWKQLRWSVRELQILQLLSETSRDWRMSLRGHVLEVTSIQKGVSESEYTSNILYSKRGI